MTSNDAVPVTVLTGFLGSGKTTVLNALLRLPDLADTAVIINEFGEVSLDHLLIEQAIENAVLLKNGCICCTVRGDIADTLGELFRRRDAGEVPWFSRIAIETTGLADPAPVIHSILDSGAPVRLDGVVTTVDAMHAEAVLARQAEAQNQVAFADRILLTKTDLATAAETAGATRAIRGCNPRAPVLVTAGRAMEAEDVFGVASDIVRPLAHDHHDHHDHHHDIGAVVIRAARPVSREALQLWLSSILSLRGAAVLRLKGVVELETGPVVVQAIHQVLHPILPLGAAAQAVRGEVGSEIVVIHRGLSAAGLQASFEAALEG